MTLICLAAIAANSPGLCPLLAAWQAWEEQTPFTWLTPQQGE
jgi:hypothetical protein